MKEQMKINPTELKEVKTELMRFFMGYRFALDQMKTKIDTLKSEFKHIHDYNPIEHVTSRIKSPESIMRKVHKKNCPFTIEGIRENIRDIAGLRITCSFETDIYVLRDMLQKHRDIKIIEEKDYIKNPKGNGYRSLHLIIAVPVFMSDREEEVLVEVQIRTIAMDFWATLEHKIYYKYNKDIPNHIKLELTEAATVAHQLDKKMEALHTEMNVIKANNQAENELEVLELDGEQFHLPTNFLDQLNRVNWI
ncbi:GTP pyrophosphokinase family protein [Amphibacillus sp. MSJ-3]|uniref:GTP pyrophosphokinase n=1 Tax=Amphibacillus sp. MSJ-3 TaxID=2841505 RepID=UPI0020A03AC8|nr:GTP pyrophosphokinase family protein [Amphibacillus sp. MSJ-3]